MRAADAMARGWDRFLPNRSFFRAETPWSHTTVGVLTEKCVCANANVSNEDSISVVTDLDKIYKDKKCMSVQRNISFSE